jgi:hypothetical protein
MPAKLKTVKAIRQGSYDGHRRRVGAEFVVLAEANESWFVDVGPAPADAELPSQLQNAQATTQRGRSFVEVMKSLGEPAKLPEGPQEQTLAEAASALPNLPAADTDADLM